MTDKPSYEELERKYRAVVDCSMDAILMTAPDGRIIFVNHAACELFQMAPEDFLKGGRAAVVDEADPRLAGALAVREQTGKLRGELRFKKKDGSIFHGEVSSIIFNDAAGEKRTSMVVRDISQRKKAEERHKKRNTFIEAILTNLPIGLAVNRISDNIVTYMNKKYEEIYGWPKASFSDIDSFFTKVYPDPEYRKKLLERIMADILSGDPEKMRWENITATGMNGEKRIVSAVNIPLFDQDLMISTVQDVTGRLRAEESLRESEEKYRSLFESLMDGVAESDMDGNIIDCNKAYADMAGYTEEEIKTLRYHDLTPEKWREEDEKQVEKTLERGYSDLYEKERIKKEGTVFPISIRMWIRSDKNGKAIGRWGIIRDIKERKHAEDEKAKLQDQLFEARKMEAVGQLAGGVAHDFNNMLGIILGHAEMGMDQVDPSQPLYADLDEIRKAAHHSAELTRQLLAFARKQIASPKMLDLNDTVAGMLKMLFRVLGEHISLSWKPAAFLWPIRIDPAQVDQILTNLSANARDAINGEGALTIETANRMFDERDSAAHPGITPGEYVMLSVNDTGPGMDKDTLAHIFEPFFTTKEVGKGTGMGLSSIYGIVKQNNGFIDVESEPGKGTTFKIYLPRSVDRPLDIAAEAPGEPVKGGSETILLVEDEPAILKMTELLLESLGYTVLTAPAPAEAIRCAETYAGEIHLLMTDVVMPEMNGRDLAKHLLSLYPNLKRLFMSGYTADIIAHHGVVEEGVNFLQKPFTKRELAARVREALRKAEE